MTYRWKYYFKTRYTESETNECESFSTNQIDFDFIKPYFDSNYEHNLDEFKLNFTDFTISFEAIKAITYLIEHYSIKITKENLYALSAAIQCHYIKIDNNRINVDDSWDDVQFYNKDYALFFDFLEKYMKGEDPKSMSLIIKSFGKSFKFKSFLFFNDLIDLYIKGNGLNLDNFNNIKTKKLLKAGNVQLDKFSEYCKLNYMICLHSFIDKHINETKSSNSKIKFVTFFLLLSQVPISSVASEITTPQELGDLNDSDTKNTRHFLNETKSIFVK